MLKQRCPSVASVSMVYHPLIGLCRALHLNQLVLLLHIPGAKRLPELVSTPVARSRSKATVIEILVVVSW